MQKNIGILFGVLAAFCYSLLSVFVKLAQDVPNETLVFFRNLICLFILFPFLKKSKISLKTKLKTTHLIRAIAGVAALFCFYYANKNLALTDSLLLVNTSPLFMPLVIWIWRKKKISKAKLIALFIGFLGVGLILKPQFALHNIAGYIGLLSGLLASIAYVGVNKLSTTEPTFRILFYFFVFALIVSFFPMIKAWKNILSLTSWVYIFLIGSISFIFQMFMTKAYTYLPTTKASCLGYLSIIISGFFGWMIWDQIPDGISVLGMLFIISSGIYILDFHREKIDKLEQIARAISLR